MKLKRENQILTLVLIIFMVGLNAFLIYENSKLVKGVNYHQALSHNYKKNEIKLFDILGKSIDLLGKEIKISNCELLEELSYFGPTPIFFVKKDICDTCKDDLYSTLDKIKKDSLSFQNQLKVVLFDENSKTLGKGTEEFLSDIVDLHYMDSKYFAIENNYQIPDMFVMVINKDIRIISYYEYEIGYGELLIKYLKSIDQSLYKG